MRIFAPDVISELETNTILTLGTNDRLVGSDEIVRFHLRMQAGAC
jgi:hypothetical protein